MIAATWSQLAAVIRIEIAKTFFSRRSVWIYLLALLPAAIFYVNSIYSKREHVRLSKIAIEHPVSSEALRQVRMFSSIGQVTNMVGEPYRKVVRNFTFGNPPQKHERITYW